MTDLLALLVLAQAQQNVPVTFTGGYQTDPQDRGRPVVLVAAGLGVKPEVFREAFRGVTPARGGHPTPEQARANKAALMRVLAPYGVTNDLLDTVSNWYRYRPQSGELWRHTPATAHAVIEKGKIKSFVITNPGAGYSSPPNVTVPGYATTAKAAIAFGKDLGKNGSIAEIK